MAGSLGDLAWYRMAVAAMVNEGSRGQGSLTRKQLPSLRTSSNLPQRSRVLQNPLAMRLPQELMIALPQVSE
jgi:hypothetical protein